MTRETQIRFLIDRLVQEMPEYRRMAEQTPRGGQSERRLLRGLMNLRPPMPLGEDFLAAEGALLDSERAEWEIVAADSLPVTASDSRLALWRGDITRIAADAIVNAGNSDLLGCFCPCHGCIDNAIHSAAGLELRDECNRLMQAQGHPEPNGRAKLTKGYHLPARYVLHTVGPVVRGAVTRRNREELASCYRSCLSLAAEYQLRTVVFCCISTGEFHFPNREAAEIAASTVKDFLSRDSSIQRVVFNVFQETDEAIYRELLGPDRTTETADRNL